MNTIHLLPSLNIFGGTPMKTKWLIDNTSGASIVFCKEPEGMYFSRKYNTLFNCTLIFGSGNVVRDFFILFSAVRRYNIEIIHSYFFSGQFFAFLLKLLSRKLIIINSFEGVPLHVPLVKKKIFNYVYKHFNHFIFISNYVRDEMLNIFPSIRQINGEVIYNGAIKREETKSNLECGNYVLCVAGLNEYKNLNVLLDAFNILKTNGIDLKLLIIGDGPLKNQLKDKIDSLGLNSTVFLLGYKENVGDYYSNCLFYVHSADKEGFGLVVIEAMLFEKTVILSDAGGLRELITDGIEGLFAKFDNPEDWAEKITYLIDNPEVVNKLAKNAYVTAINRFNIESYVRNIELLYCNLISLK